MADRGAPPFPERIGRYDVLLPIASGGMGTVYLARATSIGGFEREVALKLMHSHLKENAAFESDLVEEAKLTVRIRHPNVVSVNDVGADPFGIYLVMDYVEGDTLAGLHRRAIASSEKHLPVRFGLKLLLDALTGLHAAHELKDSSGQPTNLVHRDFSPQNILVGVDGIGRLTDFGIAKAATRVSETATGMIKGKIAYMAPEQARGAKVDRRTDIWAAGVVAWQLIAGRKLYGSQENEVSTLLKIASEPPPRLRDVKPDVPADFDEAVARALTMDIDQRWPTAQAFKQALSNACRAHGETADTDEVAVFVSRVVETVVATRRARVNEILLLRAKVEKLATHPDASGSTPSGELAAIEETATVAIGNTTTVVITRADGLNDVPVPQASSPPRRWVAIAIGAVAVSMLTTIALAVSLASHSQSSATSNAPPSPSVSMVAVQNTTVAPSASVPPLTIELRVAPAASAATRETAHAIAPPRLRNGALSASSTSVLPRSPYQAP